METENTVPAGNSGNRTWLIVGGAFVFLCLCAVCIGAGFFMYNSGTFAGFSPAEEPTPFPTFAMPTIPPLLTPIAEPTLALSQSTALSNVRTTADREGWVPKSTFAPSETIYLVGDLSGVVEGDAIKSAWYGENVPGFPPNSFINDSTIFVGVDPVEYVYFYFEPPPDGWPTGEYKVEVFFNDELHSTVRFSVQ